MAAERSALEEQIAAAGGPEAFAAIWGQVDHETRVRASYDWRNVARPKQLPPPSDWRVWVVRAGRGFGKTLTGAQFVRMEVERGAARRIALIARTAADGRDVMVEGVSGILAVSPPWNRPKYEPSKRRLTWANGATATMFSAEEPDLLRGPQHDLFWADEIAAWERLDETWSNLMFGLRLGARPRGIATSTPRPLRFLSELEAEPTTAVTRGSTYENAENLAPSFLDQIRKKYEGTRLGRQEIEAEILDDNPRALWRRSWIDSARMTVERFNAVARPWLRSVVTSVDPAVSNKEDSDETGIVVVAAGNCRCGLAPDRLHGFVLADVSGVYRPLEWAEAVGVVCETHGAHRVIAEVNQGGDLVEANLRTCERTRTLAYRGVHVKDGKRLRAEPVASLYEIGICHHVGNFGRLEDQMVEWDPMSQDSPDRVDAVTQGMTDLLVKPAPPSYQRHEKPILKPRR